MPRRAIEALETEVRALAERVDRTRQAGADGAALGSLERELAEVRNALRSLTPAESLAGFEEAVRGAVAQDRSDRRIRPGAPGRSDGVQAARAGGGVAARRRLQRRLGRRAGAACRRGARTRRPVRARHRRQQHRSARQARSTDRVADGKRPRRAARTGRLDPRAQRTARPHAAQPGRSACARRARGSHRQAFGEARRLRFPARPSRGHRARAWPTCWSISRRCGAAARAACAPRRPSPLPHRPRRHARRPKRRQQRRRRRWRNRRST